MIGRSIRDIGFRGRFDAAVIAVKRNDVKQVGRRPRTAPDCAGSGDRAYGLCRGGRGLRQPKSLGAYRGASARGALRLPEPLEAVVLTCQTRPSEIAANRNKQPKQPPQGGRLGDVVLAKGDMLVLATGPTFDPKNADVSKNFKKWVHP
jgi:hypothetical protein